MCVYVHTATVTRHNEMMMMTSENEGLHKMRDEDVGKIPGRWQ